MRCFLKGKHKDIAFEILSYDASCNKAVLRGVDGIVTDTNFVLYMVRRVYDLVHEEPLCLKGKGHAIESGL